MKRRLRVAVLTGGAALVAALLAGPALAQDDDLEAAVGRTQSGAAATREAQVQAAAQPPNTADRQALAIFHHKRGMANQLLGNYARAVADLRLALENHQPGRPAPDGWGDRWRIQNSLGNAHRERGDWTADIELWVGVAAEYQKGDLFNYHYAQLRLMDAHMVLAQWAEGEKARQEAEAVLLRLRSQKGWATRGFNVEDQHNHYMGIMFGAQGNHREAERRFRLSLAGAEKHLEWRRSTLPEGHESIRVARGNLGTAKRRVAEILSTQGRYGEAELLARSALDDMLALNALNTIVVGRGLAAIGWARFQQGDVAGAEKYYRHALAAVEGSGTAAHSTRLAGRRADLAKTHLVQGRWAEALSYYEARDRGLRSDKVQFERTGSRHVGWAYALHKAGESQRAADMAQRLIASRLKRPAPDPWGLAQRRGVLAMALAATGRTAEALASYRQSIPDLVRRDQEDSAAEDIGYWRVFWQRAILEGYLELLAKLHAAGDGPAGLDLADESFRIADIARGSTVQEAISSTAARAQLPDRNLAELARREQDTLNRAVALSQVLGRLAASPDQERLSKVASDMRAEIERLRKEHAGLRADIRKRYPEYADLIDPRPAGLADIRKALRSAEALVAIYLGDMQSYVWTIGTGGKASLRVVPVKRGEVEADVQELRKAVDLGDGNPGRLRPFDLARAHKLYRLFFEPDAALWQDAQVLNVIPHGALAQVPMALLVTELPAARGDAAYREAPWLIRKVAISQLPSASAYTALRRAPGGNAARQPFVGFGDPVFAAGAVAGASRSLVRNLELRRVADRTEEQLKAGLRGGSSGQQGPAAEGAALSRAFSQLGALPDTSDELKEIATVLKADLARDVFLTGQATEKNVKLGALENRRVIVFATHGIAPGEILGLDQPALVLSNPTLTGDTDNDGFLTMEEVLALKLDADWVVLSACNTASADGRGSEAVSGLGRAFFYAGARSLLVSNWAVETTSARLLTTELFRRQAADPKLTRAEALRQSMLDLMGKKGPGGFSYAHPAFWAPFSLVGDGGR